MWCLAHNECLMDAIPVFDNRLGDIWGARIPRKLGERVPLGGNTQFFSKEMVGIPVKEQSFSHLS